MDFDSFFIELRASRREMSDGNFVCSQCGKRLPYLDVEHDPEAIPETTAIAIPGATLCHACYYSLGD